MNRTIVYITTALLFLILSLTIQARNEEEEYVRNKYQTEKYMNMLPQSAAFNPYIFFRAHKNGKFWNVINNNGILGNFFYFEDPDLAKNAASYYYPKYSRFRHGFYTGLWIGGVVGTDTLVSTSVDVDWRGWWTPYRNEFWPDEYPMGDFIDIERPYSLVVGKNQNQPNNAEAVFQATYTDSFSNNNFVPYSPYDLRLHIPLDIEITQTSYSWSYDYAEDFILIDYKIRNIGTEQIKDMYFGQYHAGAVHHVAELPYPKLDDIEGFIDSIPFEIEELGNEAMNISWVCDRNGSPYSGSWGLLSTVNTFGIAPLALPEGANNINFNWWTTRFGYDGNWGPRQIGTPEKPVRLYDGQLGRPNTDKQKYHMMSLPEVDYSGYEAAVDHSMEGWLPPSEYAEDLAKGHEVFYLSSYGPFTIDAGHSENVVIAYSIGQNIHRVASAYSDYFDPQDPSKFMEFLNFEDLIDNMRWAKRIYDNPGVDTDNDGDSGKYFYYEDPLTQESLKVFYEGDGVPDLRGATPPPPPPIRVITEDGKIIVRWNGRTAENYFDSFSLLKDFEGYRVYIARSPSMDDLTLLSSYDWHNYNRYRWNHKLLFYELKETPFTYDSLVQLYGDGFDPTIHTQANPLVDNGNYYYFTQVDYNLDNLDDPSNIHKMYPDALPDTTDVDEEGRMRYYEYEYIVEGLLSTVPYYISVTAFDFGHPSKSLGSLESSPLNNVKEVFAIQAGDDHLLQNEKLNVYVYPNPYRIDGAYRDYGFENRYTDLSVERARTIYFANLPSRCTISIYTIDGDLVKEINHDEPEFGGTAMMERFDLISRNVQAITSGLYYWVVESEYGSQVGKLTIIY